MSATLTPAASPISSGHLTLDQLAPGQSARIIRIDGVDGVSSRLREMGFIAGELVKYIRRAPFRGPVNCSVAGSRVAVRDGEARRVEVECVPVQCVDVDQA